MSIKVYNMEEDVMGFGIIKRLDDNGLWLQQDITKEKFDSMINNLVKFDKCFHEWAKWYDDMGHLIKGVIFDGKENGQKLTINEYESSITHTKIIPTEKK